MSHYELLHDYTVTDGVEVIKNNIYKQIYNCHITSLVINIFCSSSDVFCCEPPNFIITYIQYLSLSLSGHIVWTSAPFISLLMPVMICPPTLVINALTLWQLQSNALSAGLKVGNIGQICHITPCFLCHSCT